MKSPVFLFIITLNISSSSSSWCDLISSRHWCMTVHHSQQLMARQIHTYILLIFVIIYIILVRWNVIEDDDTITSSFYTTYKIPTCSLLIYSRYHLHIIIFYKLKMTQMFKFFLNYYVYPFFSMISLWAHTYGQLCNICGL